MGFEEATVQGSKKQIIITIFFIQSRRFGGLFPPSSGFWKISERNTMWHSTLSPLWGAVTILYSISFSVEFSLVLFTLPYREGMVKYCNLAWKKCFFSFFFSKYLKNGWNYFDKKNWAKPWHFGLQKSSNK